MVSRMPPTPIPAGFGIATVKYLRTGATAPYVTTWGYSIDAAITAAAEAANINGRWIGVWTAATTLNDYTLTGVHVLRNNAGALESGDYVASTTGTVAAQAENPATAVCITKQTALAGRKYRGRAYMPPAFISEANVSDAGIIDAGTLGGIQGRANGWLAVMTGSANDLYLLHSDGSAPTLITNLLVRTSVRTQRRRQQLV